LRERTEGKTAYAIARDLNKDTVPTAQGARAWSQATVRALLMREGVSLITANRKDWEALSPTEKLGGASARDGLADCLGQHRH
jgi:hypothetical protein